MLYELFVGWRYLFNRRNSKALWVVFALCLVFYGGGLGLFYWTQFKTIGAFMMIIGGLGVAASLLLAFFSTFTAISILGLAIGVSVLIWVLSVTSGFQEAFREKVLGVNAHILILKYGIDFSEYREKMKQLEKVPEVVASSPFVFNEMMIAKGQRISGVLVKGVDPVRVGKVLDIVKHINRPRRIRDEELRKILVPAEVDKHTHTASVGSIIIGSDLAEKLEVKVGDLVRLISPLSGLDTAGWTPSGEIPRSRDLRVAAIFFSGFNEYDRRLVYVHLKEAQAFMDQGDVVTGIDLKIRDVFAAKSVARKVSHVLGGSPYRTIDWSELNHNLFTALNIQKLFLRIIIGFITVVAAFNVLAALTVLVIRKTREISILKSMGTSSAGVARIFVCTGIIIWLLGTGLGLIWGYLGCRGLAFYGFPLDPKVYHISTLPVRMEPLEFGITAVFALIWCVLLTLYPSARAAKLNPVEGLRYE